jgi:hypothetical protein
MYNQYQRDRYERDPYSTYDRQFSPMNRYPTRNRRNDSMMPSYFDEYNPQTPQYYEDRIYEDENQEYDRPSYRPSNTISNPDFGNFNFKKGYTAEVWMNDGETIVLSAHTRKKTYRTHYSPEYMRSFFFGWIGRLLRWLYLDRLFGLHIDTVKTVITKNFIFVTAHALLS